MTAASPTENSDETGSPYTLAAGMLWQDRALLMPLFALLVLPVALEIFFAGVSLEGAFIMLLVQRLVQLVFLYVITRRWLRMLSLKSAPARPGAAARFFAAGFAVWLALISPLLLQFLAASEGLRLISMLLLVPLVILWLRYYFYFLPIALGVGDYKNVAQFSASIVQADRKVPFYTMISPLGIVALLCGIFYLPAPDGRSAVLFLLASLSAELLWPLCCYLSLAFAFTLMSEQLWRSFDLEPYRQDRFATLRVGAPKFLSRLLTAKTGGKLLLAGALIWVVNRVQLETLPPAPKIEVAGASVQGDEIKLTLRMSDPQYNFRGFQPANFALAGEERHLVSEELKNVESDAGGRELLFQIPPSLDTVTISLTFRNNRSGEALKQLEDLYLWYRLTKVSKLSLK